MMFQYLQRSPLMDVCLLARESNSSLVGVDGRLGAACAIRKTCLELNFAVTLNSVAKKILECYLSFSFLRSIR